ncbi:MAG TPA: condensation domain-containing protein, partial [Candidatus Elarobacter sp.]|nr:condensation domain-containing protein [Candidatus Elarobacter sp.]
MDDRLVTAAAANGAQERFAHLSPAARALLEQRTAGRDARVDAGTSRGASDGTSAPLSFAQRRVWFFEQITPGTATYNRPKRITLDGPLDVPALRRAVREIFRRHEVLRSAIDVRDGAPLQHVLPLELDYLQIVDLSHDADVERSWLAAADAEALRPFDMAAGPLARCVLVRLAAERHVLLFTASHLAFDGWSTGLLCSELGALYRAFATGRDSPLPELTRQYRDVAAHESLHWTDARAEPEVAYWKDALRGAPPAVRLPREASRI